MGKDKKADKISEWLSSGEYQTDIDEMRTSIMRDASTSNSESTTASIFERELYYFVRSKTGLKLDFKKEQKVDNITHKFMRSQVRTSSSGRLDAVINNLIIEYKHHSKLNSQDQYKIACEQIEEYLEALLKNENEKYNAILTDGIRIAYFSFVGNSIQKSVLSALANRDIDLIVKALVNNNKKKFDPRNILKDFSIDSVSDSTSKRLARKLYELLTKNSTDKTKMLFEEWQNLMHLSVEDKGKGNDIEKRRKDLSLIFLDDIDSPKEEYQALYALQTTYAIIVKLIACKVIDKLDYNNAANTYHDLTMVTSKEMQKFFVKMEDGYSYRSSNIYNLLEGDYFSWYSDENQWSKDLWQLKLNIIKEIDQYSAFSFNIIYEPIDIFKDLYMSIIPRSIRHSMGEYFTPQWLADYVVGRGLQMVDRKSWKVIDPCCGSGIFIFSAIKHIVGRINIQSLSDNEKIKLRNEIINRVYGIDINPLSILSARVGYYLALQPFGDMKDVEIPVYLGDSAIIPEQIILDNIKCYKYVVANSKLPFEIILPERLVKQTNFGQLMNQLQACVKTEDSKILFEVINGSLDHTEKKSTKLIDSIRKLSKNLTTLHKNNWDGIWVRISTNFMLIARLSEFDLITGNPPWVKWEHLPSTYANRIKEMCSIKHIFSNDGGQYGGTQLNICALISNVTASNWLTKKGVLAFLMPDSIMSQNSYEEFRNFYIDYDKKIRLFLREIDRWKAPLRPFWCDDKVVTQDFNTYYYSYKQIDYKKGIPVVEISRKPKIKDAVLNQYNTFDEVKPYLIFGATTAKQLSNKSTAFSYINGGYDFSKIIGPTSYEYRTGVEFTPQELYMLVGKGPSAKLRNYRFANKTFNLSKYKVDDTPKDGWDFSTGCIYPIVTGPIIKPFKYKYANEYCILPYDKKDTKNPIDVNSMMAKHSEVFNYLIDHKDKIDSQSEKSKMMHRGKEFYALSKIGPYSFAPYIVAARDNSKFCATVVRPMKTPWGETKSTICVKHTIVIGRRTDGTFISGDEAYFISGILNSNVVVDYIQSTFKSNGYSLNKSNIYLPVYDDTILDHKRISELAKKAEKVDDVNSIQNELTDLYLKICENKI